MNDKLKLRSVEIAYALFKPAEHEHRVFVACFCWRKNRLIEIGVNRDRTHPINLHNPLVCRRTGRIVHENKKICAELDAFISLKNKTNYDFRDISMVNVRINRRMELCMSKCCSSCENLVRYLRPKEIFYTNQSGQFEQYHY